MWPWETEPRSMAHGILDDETYDWLPVVTAMADGNGAPVIATEACGLQYSDATPGGLGLLMIRSFSDVLTYQRDGERNQLRFGVRWTPAL